MSGFEQDIDEFEAMEYVSIELRHLLPNTGSIVSHRAEVPIEVKVSALKADFCHKFGSPANTLKWIYKTQTLEDDKTLMDYHVCDKAAPAVISVKKI